MQTGQGTKNRNRGIEECVQRTQIFKAQMAVGSWYNTPLMNDLGAVTSIMRTKMAKSKGKASRKEKSNEIIIHSN
ncbi:hypothetical protein BDR03DRAFT_962025 [Suillus americanus]|nr:hypothetical protein BDR03DRAFT_962025 [Suillus americanus]